MRYHSLLLLQFICLCMISYGGEINNDKEARSLLSTAAKVQIPCTNMSVEPDFHVPVPESNR